MNIGLTLISNNLNMDYGILILLVLVLGCLIFFAKDFKLGSVLLFLISGSCFMLSYGQGWNYAPSIIVFFMSLIMMAFSLYGVGRVTEQGRLV